MFWNVYGFEQELFLARFFRYSLALKISIRGHRPLRLPLGRLSSPQTPNAIIAHNTRMLLPSLSFPPIMVTPGIMSVNCSFRDEFPMILVGNKSDLENERTVSTAEAQELGRKLRVS